MRRTGVCLCTLHFENVLPAQYQWYPSENSETAVDKPPNDGQASNLARYESQRNDSCTGNEAESDNPLVPYRITVGSDEGHRDDKMSEGQPVGAVGQKRIVPVCAGEGVVDSGNPGE